MPVFISHRTADDRLADYVADQLRTRGISVYLDNIDPELASSRGTRKLTQLLINRLKSCTNLLALVTGNTRGSWWVPFEIGAARLAPRMIATYTELDAELLPEYLTEWPVLRGSSSIEKFAAEYKRHAPIAKRSLLEGRAVAGDGFASIDSFHSSLKRSLGQY